MPERNSPFLIEPEQIRTLLTLVDRKTFSGAATALGVQQSAISHQVLRMEQKLDRKLFQRTGSGVEATSDGEALIIYARAMLKLDASMRRQFLTTRQNVTLRIGMVDDLSRTALPTVLWLFSREYPAFEFRIATGRPSSLIGQIQEGRLEAAIVRHRGDLIGAEPIWADRLVWVGRAGTPVPVCDPVPLVLPAAPSALRDLVFGSLQKVGRSWRVPFEGNGLPCLEAGLRAGLGVGAFPASMERFEINELNADAGLPTLPDMHYGLLRATSPISEAAAAFCQVFRDAARLSFRMEQLTSP